MTITNQEIWEAKGDASTKAMLLLMNSKNDAAKKDLRLLYLLGNKTAYLGTAESMARYLLTQYNNKVPNNPRDERGDRNSQKGDDAKSEDSDTTTTGSAGAHVGEVTPQNSAALSKGASIGAYISEISQPTFCPSRSVEELVVAHPVNDTIWNHSNQSDVSIDTANSTEIIAGSYIT